jgi:hypothetical protein
MLTLSLDDAASAELDMLPERLREMRVEGGRGLRC